jgi:hypothetical protein
MKITKENAIAQVTSSVSSIFSKEDVLFLLNSIEEGRMITVLDIQRAIDKTIDSLEMNCDDIIDKDDCEFEIDYDNRIRITEVPINFDFIRESIENNFMDFGETIEEDIVELERVENEL